MLARQLTSKCAPCIDRTKQRQQSDVPRQHWADVVRRFTVTGFRCKAGFRDDGQVPRQLIHKQDSHISVPGAEGSEQPSESDE